MVNLKLTPQKLIYFIVYYYFFATFLIGFFRIPSVIYYVTDIANILLLYFVLKRTGKIVHNMHLRLVNIALSFFSIVITIGAVINAVQFPLLLIGIRNTYRFFIIFFAAILFLNKSDIERFMAFFFKIQIVNLLIGLYKYFVQGLWADDFGGGFFLNGSGLNPFCLMLVCYYMSAYLYKKEGGKKLLFVLLSSLLLGMFAEEKAMILSVCLCVVIIFILACLYNPTIEQRRVGLIIVSLFAVPLLLNVFKIAFPTIISNISSFETLVEIGESSFDTGYRIPRLGAFEVINGLFLKTRIHQWFGLGLGNCDSAAFFKSSFSQLYGNYNYRWFTHQWTYLECGKLGFYSYVAFFVAISISMLTRVRKYSKDVIMIGISTAVYAIVMIIFMWHSAAIKTDSGAYIFLALAFGFIYLREGSRERKKK